MSTRFLGLISTAAVAALAVAGCAARTDARLTAAEAPVPSPSASAGAADAPSAADAPKGRKSAAKDGTDLNACLDADCEVEVADGQRIPLDPKYGVDGIDVRTDGPRVFFTASGRNSKMVTSMDTSWAGTGSSSTVNGLTFRPRMTKDGKIIVRVSHD
ncbi:hypothetical protein GCM10009527_010670 [Actinomadura nitritigenes]|uniref:Lipoprotein n=1 Tax=Actinomadura nitritigenes TaxID=134602 RepID=A0ABS3R2X0_9ACTN|nr:hypothetical protein [Actinomadura nitritigenes]MBO2439944.1 hypothetical protein [Actinomadura nitritigenes]